MYCWFILLATVCLGPGVISLLVVSVIENNIFMLGVVIGRNFCNGIFSKLIFSSPQDLLHCEE